MKKKVRDYMSMPNTIMRNSVISQADADRIMVHVRVSFERMKLGGSDDHFDWLASALNAGLIRAEKIHIDLVKVINHGLLALLNSDRIRLAQGHYGFAGLDFQAMNEALDAYEVILRASTYKEMFDASIEVGERLRKGQFTEALV